ncbi:hypothetical protein BGAL_0065g00120 [Botrytis galanthina]|uniref:Phosphoesterase HXTX domain-containing protein n=1 Tax=Botrytis galanthina TaxID=278940 RepID=A0A4S8RH30_9HELO|nr:hypothetical protein BGAL_0065g00120 [Botrytis galanthina]
MSQPFILTLRLDAASEKLLTALRTRYFPSSRNYLSAHITLFHALPSSQHFLYKSTLSSLSSRERKFKVGIKDPFPLGKKGVALNIASFKLRKIHEELLEEFREKGVQLTEQDDRKIRPHVTVQNKVEEEEAKRTLEEVKKEWTMHGDGNGGIGGMAEAISLWRYEVSGEWTHLEDYEFA